MASAPSTTDTTQTASANPTSLTSHAAASTNTSTGIAGGPTGTSQRDLRSSDVGGEGVDNHEDEEGGREREKRTAQARAAITAHFSSIGNQHLKPLEQRAADIKANSAAITKQEAELERQTKQLEKESAKLDKEATATSKKLKELGDIQNWAEVLERDLRVIEETVRMGEGEDLEWSDVEDVEHEEGVGTVRREEHSHETTAATEAEHADPDKGKADSSGKA